MQTHCVGRDNQQLNLSTLTLLYRHILLSPVTEGDSNSQHFSFDIVLYVPIPDPRDHSSRAIATLQPQLECQSEPSVLSHRAPKCSYLVQQHPSCAYKPILSELKSQVPAHKPRRAREQRVLCPFSNNESNSPYSRPWFRGCVGCTHPQKHASHIQKSDNLNSSHLHTYTRISYSLFVSLSHYPSLVPSAQDVRQYYWHTINSSSLFYHMFALLYIAFCFIFIVQLWFTLVYSYSLSG